MSENEKYRRVLIELMVPSEAIVSDGRSTNTLMEAQIAISFLKENGLNPKKVILVSRPVHQRRAFLTFFKQYSHVHYINCPAREVFNDGDEKIARRIVQEIQRIWMYYNKGDIENPGKEFKSLFESFL